MLFTLEVIGMRVVWEKATGLGYKYAYKCVDGRLKDSEIRFLKLDRFEKNRHGRIVLHGDRQFILNYLDAPMHNSCKQWVNRMWSIDTITKEYTFVFSRGGKESGEFLNHIKQIDSISTMGWDMIREIAETVGQSAAPFHYNPRLFTDQSDDDDMDSYGHAQHFGMT